MVPEIFAASTPLFYQQVTQTSNMIITRTLRQKKNTYNMKGYNGHSSTFMKI